MAASDIYNYAVTQFDIVLPISLYLWLIWRRRIYSSICLLVWGHLDV